MTWLATARQIDAGGDLAGHAVFSEDGTRALLGLYAADALTLTCRAPDHGDPGRLSPA